MSASKKSSSDVANKMSKRNLPSWVISREDGSKSQGRKLADESLGGDSQEGATHEAARGHRQTLEVDTEGTGYTRKSSTAGPSALQFSKLLEGVVFALSGLVNPERSILRSQAMEMGAEYQPDWNSNCTLLVCAFPNTPKFRQVEAERGTIVSKEWIKECYNQKKLVDIDTYLMHAGKPWRRGSISHVHKQDHETSLPRICQEQEESRPSMEPNASRESKTLKGGGAMKPARESFSPFKVKRWAIDDLKKTIAWLESQDEKPEPSEIKKVAAEGILTCLEDAIELLDKEEDLQQLTEQWNMIPRVVEELVKIGSREKPSASVAKQDLRKQAVTCKEIYEQELRSVCDDSTVKQQQKNNKRGKSQAGSSRMGETAGDSAGYYSDETIEMTEAEIEQAYKSIASKLRKS
ncbi:hypothetical protein Ancab_011982 [Ancistrocladus abbreviatus]